MVIQDYTKYLGKNVSFILPFRAMGDMFGDNVVEKVTGEINMICLAKNLEDSEFFVGDDSYFFSEVTFIDLLDF